MTRGFVSWKQLIQIELFLTWLAKHEAWIHRSLPEGWASKFSEIARR